MIEAYVDLSSDASVGQESGAAVPQHDVMPDQQRHFDGKRQRLRQGQAAAEMPTVAEAPAQRGAGGGWVGDGGGSP